MWTGQSLQQVSEAGLDREAQRTEVLFDHTNLFISFSDVRIYLEVVTVEAGPDGQQS